MNTTAKLIEATKKAPKLGPKETALRAKREEVGGDIPDFLKRTETEAQAEARRKKHAPKNDSKGLTVITPPDPKIMAAVAKDFIEKGQKAQSAVDTINAARAKDGLRPYEPKKSKLSSLTSIPSTAGKSDGARARRMREKEGRVVPPKKAGSLVEKALKARDELAAKAKAKTPEKAAVKLNTKAANKPKKSSADKKRKVDLMLQALARKNGVDNAELAKILGARPSAATMRKVCETHSKRFKIVKKEGEPTRYMTA